MNSDTITLKFSEHQLFAISNASLPTLPLNILKACNKEGLSESYMTRLIRMAHLDRSDEGVRWIDEVLSLRNYSGLEAEQVLKSKMQGLTIEQVLLCCGFSRNGNTLLEFRKGIENGLDAEHMIHLFRASEDADPLKHMHEGEGQHIAHIRIAMEQGLNDDIILGMPLLPNLAGFSENWRSAYRERMDLLSVDAIIDSQLREWFARGDAPGERYLSWVAHAAEKGVTQAWVNSLGDTGRLNPEQLYIAMYGYGKTSAKQALRAAEATPRGVILLVDATELNFDKEQQNIIWRLRHNGKEKIFQVGVAMRLEQHEIIDYMCTPA